MSVGGRETIWGLKYDIGNMITETTNQINQPTGWTVKTETYILHMINSLKKERLKEKRRTSNVRTLVSYKRASSFQPWFLYTKWIFTKTSAVQKLCTWVKRASTHKLLHRITAPSPCVYLQYKTSQKLNRERGICVKKHVQICSSEPTHCYILYAVYITLAVFLSKWKAFSREDRRICIKSTSFPHRRGHTLSLLRKKSTSLHKLTLEIRGENLISSSFPLTQTQPLMFDGKIAFPITPALP